MAISISGLFKKKVKEEPKKEPPKEESAEAPPEKVVEKETSTKRSVPKKPVPKDKPKASGKTPAKTGTSKRTPAKKGTSKTASKKAPAKKPAEKDVQTAGSKPSELKGIEKELKNYAERSRMTYDSKSTNKIFTEYLRDIFHDLGYKMVIVCDGDDGILTMLDKDDVGGDSIRSKIVVKCVYKRKGSVDVESVIDAQENGRRLRGEKTWCITTTDFDDDAVRKSKKKDAKVKLFDGNKLYAEFLSKADLRK